jgi:hypothetical protein
MLGAALMLTVGVPRPEPGLHRPHSDMLGFDAFTFGIAVGAVYVVSRAVVR